MSTAKFSFFCAPLYVLITFFNIETGCRCIHFLHFYVNSSEVMCCRRRILLQLALIMIHYVHTSLSSPYHNNRLGMDIAEARHYAPSPYLSPSTNIQPVVPILAPIPMVPFTYDSVPKLSGLCAFNFSFAENTLKVTAADCWSSLAPYLANVVCCPQFEATLVILMGQYSNATKILTLNETHAKHCISDVEKILESNGAGANLHSICSIDSTILAHASCPVSDSNEVDRILDDSLLLDSCMKIEEANECCSQVCQNAISDAAGKLASRKSNITGTEEAEIVIDCKNIVHTWLASKLEPSSTNRVLRLLSNCNKNKACPLVFPDIKNVSKECGDTVTNRTSCCDTLENYMSQLQEQSFITNMQALNCAASLGLKLRNQNVSTNIYNLCHTKLKEFSIQVDSKESGCLFSNLPSDITFDKRSGIGFICDLNGNVEAPWPSGPRFPDYSCNKSTILPQLPKAASAQRGLHNGDWMFAAPFAVLLF